MFKLKSILWEQIEEDEEELGLYDYSQYEGSIPNQEKLKQLIEIEKKRHPGFHIRKVDFPSKNVWVYGFGNKPSYTRYEAPEFVIEQNDAGEFDVEPVKKWFEDISFSDRFFDYLELDLEEIANQKFWEYPSILYHGTTKEGKEAILVDGLLPKARTRGISNRSIGAAIFTSTEIEGTSDYVEENGGAVFEINTRQMKKDGYTPRIYTETLNEEEEYKSILAAKLGLEYDKEEEPGMEDTTVIFKDPIPLKYLRMVDYQ